MILRRKVADAGAVMAVTILFVTAIIVFQPPTPDHIATPTQLASNVDAFGIRNLQPTMPGGMIWTSDWSSKPRTFGYRVDPRDRWFDGAHGAAVYRVSNGQLAVSGETPRLYVHDPALKRQWHDVEVTMYFKRVADSNIPYAGMVTAVRTDHLVDSRRECDTRGYTGRMRYDGHVDFGKETAHPVTVAFADRKVFPSEMPFNEWIGYKFIVYDTPKSVHLELWRDLTDGAHGGRWEEVDHAVDNGHTIGSKPCAPGIDPRIALTHAEARSGSESGRPNLSVYFRSTGVDLNGLVYKWGSVREISVK